MRMVVKEFWRDEEGIGVVEIILILVVLIALVLLFKEKISSVVSSAFTTFNKDATSIIGTENAE